MAAHLAGAVDEEMRHRAEFGALLLRVARNLDIPVGLCLPAAAGFMNSGSNSCQSDSLYSGEFD